MDRLLRESQWPDCRIAMAKLILLGLHSTQSCLSQEIRVILLRLCLILDDLAAAQSHGHRFRQFPAPGTAKRHEIPAVQLLRLPCAVEVRSYCEASA